MEHYVTLFDSVFLPQGLALHSSLTTHAGPFTLWVLCMDEEAKSVLDRLCLPHVRTIALADAETPELRAQKPSRNRAEYCWTLTPFTPRFVFDRDPEARRVTYVDADMFLLKSPRPIFAELESSGKAVLITDHGYDPEYDQSATSGQYCVQFMTFVRGASDPVLQWWQQRCIEWCFDRVEDGKFGDQKYLDDWPTRFADHVHVLRSLDVLLAPWNARRFPYSRAIAWHFHGLRLAGRGKVLLFPDAYDVPSVVQKQVYGPYLEVLRRCLDLLGEREIVQKAAAYRPVLTFATSLGTVIWRCVRGLRHRYPIRRLPARDAPKT